VRRRLVARLMEVPGISVSFHCRTSTRGLTYRAGGDAFMRGASQASVPTVINDKFMTQSSSVALAPTDRQDNGERFQYDDDHDDAVVVVVVVVVAFPFGRLISRSSVHKAYRPSSLD